MITSSAPGHVLEKLKRLAGPNPEGSKLGDVERLHLIFLLGAMISQEFGSDVQGWTVRLVAENLKERGMTQAEILGVFPGTGGQYNAVEVADMIAVHPSLKHPYLD